MEGTNWIAALAIRDGRNPYTDPGLAFLNMNHGPLDAPAKALIARVLPWLDGWQVIRLPGLLLPWLMVIVLRRRSEKTPPLPWRWAIAIGLTAYFVILSSGNMVAAMGRSDALMLVLLVLLLPLSGRTFTAENRLRVPWAILGGVIAGAALLGNVRAAIVLPAFALALAFDWERDRFRPNAALLRWCVAAMAGVGITFAVVVGGLFRFDFGLFYRYSLGYFLAPQGHGLSGLPRLRDLADPFVENQVWLLLPIVLIAALAISARSRATWVRAIALGAPFVLLVAAYVTNHLGAAGGLHYLAPLAIVALLLWRLADWNEQRDITIAVTVPALALLGCNWRVVAHNTSLLWQTRHSATEFTRFVRDLDARLPVESQDIHLFKTRLHPTEVDLGFLAYLTRRPGSADYYREFSERFTRHETLMRREPPAAMVVGDFPSEELAARIRSGDYVLVRESPLRIYNAENLTRTRVYLRREQAANFPVVANPTPQFRSW